MDEAKFALVRDAGEQPFTTTAPPKPAAAATASSAVAQRRCGTTGTPAAASRRGSPPRRGACVAPPGRGGRGSAPGGSGRDGGRRHHLVMAHELVQHAHRRALAREDRQAARPERVGDELLRGRDDERLAGRSAKAAVSRAKASTS